MTTIIGARESVSSPTVSAADEKKVKSTPSTGMQPSCSKMSHVSDVTKDDIGLNIWLELSYVLSQNLAEEFVVNAHLGFSSSFPKDSQKEHFPVVILKSINDNGEVHT